MAGPQGWVGLVSCAPALSDRHMDILASVRFRRGLGSEHGKGQCKTAGSEEKALLWEDLSRSRGQPRQWLLAAPVYGPGLRWQSLPERPCAHGSPGLAFLQETYSLRTLSGGQWTCSLSPSPDLSRQRSMDYLTRCLPPFRLPVAL